MKYFLLLLLVITETTFAQSDKKMIRGLTQNISYLADDKLEGRRTGTAGEKLAYEFISNAFKKNKLSHFEVNNGYIQPFEVYDGRSVTEARFAIGGSELKLMDDFFPLSYSGNATHVHLEGMNDTKAYFYRLDSVLLANKDNPHFDSKENMLQAAKNAAQAGMKVFFIENRDTVKDEIAFEKNSRAERLNIPVIYLKKAFTEMKNGPVDLHFNIAEKTRTGHNVIGHIDNNAAYTIIIGAHYDHLGYGEDHNSLYTGSTAMVHNGADDNASGTAALIELSRLIKKSKLKKFNFVFVAFSGEELGLYGSKYFTEHSPVDLKKVNYMINMDMIGRLNDSTHGLTIGGYGTSPVWAELISTNHDYFRIKFDSSGSGPSDHTSFYRKDIPVLFFFTGTHSDYHKPGDDAYKVNYKGELRIIKYIMSLIENTTTKDKLAFTKTREAASMGKSTFKVSMGIMPDYTFSGSGVLVDGVTDGRPAQKAGIKTGDIIVRLGDHTVSDVQSYMQALGKFNKGESTKVSIKRGKEELLLILTF